MAPPNESSKANSASKDGFFAMPYLQKKLLEVGVVLHVPISQVTSRLLFRQAKLPLPLTKGKSNSLEYCDCSCLVIVNMYADSYILARVVAIADFPVPVPASKIIYL